MLPPEAQRLLIFREPPDHEKVYSIFSEDGRYVCQVESSWPDFDWRLSFRTPSNTVTALISKWNGDCEFLGSSGEQQGHSRESRFSVWGKSVVAGPEGQPLGSVVYGVALIWGLTRTCFLSAHGEELGVAKTYRGEKLPVLLGPSRAHLARRYVWNRSRPGEVDELLIYTYVCGLVFSEHDQSGG